MKKYIAYIRVSTTRQGETGVSLQEQAEAIKHFAERFGLEICEWLEEQETAAKLGRPVFTRMLKRLRKGEFAGVIMHKIDRSARNLKDWAELGQLIDQGIDVHFANESLDLNSRGGRLSADIQAVVAADYIRNLREEAKKGIYGRLKQGLYPMPAPIGYQDNGRAKPKTIHPVQGPLVRYAFDLYATGRYSLNKLTSEIAKMDLRGRGGKRITRNALHRMLKNSFYTGLIHIKKTNERYAGIHERLVPTTVFNRVQDILQGKRVRGTSSHQYKYSRLLRCPTCGRSLVATPKKGHIYYRCFVSTCPTTSVREEVVEDKLASVITSIILSEQEVAVLDIEAAQRKAGETSRLSAEREALGFHLKIIIDRQNRLTDVYVDGGLSREDFDQRKTALQLERYELEEKLKSVEQGTSVADADIEKYVRLVKQASLFTEKLYADELRDWLEEATSHRSASQNNVVFTLRKPLAEVSSRLTCPNGSPRKDTPPTFWKEWLDRIEEHAKLYPKAHPSHQQSQAADHI